MKFARPRNAATLATLAAFATLPMLATMAVLAATAPAFAQTQPTPPTAAQTAPQNPCTNQPEAKCGTMAGCAWLPGYKVKDAADVPGYCRTAPKSLSGRRQQG